jgi:uncharacterized membrane protein HdeD (DUF308 family)
LRSIEGIFDILIGVLIVINPDITLQVLVLFISVWAAVKGLFYVIHARKLKRHITLFLINALLLIAFAFVLFFNPFAGAIAMTYLLASFSIVFGVGVSILAFKLRKLEHAGDKTPVKSNKTTHKKPTSKKK